MAGHRIFTTSFASIYVLYVAKVERKGRTREEVDTVVRWLTGYDDAGLARVIADETDMETFFAQAPRMNPDAALITGVICGLRVEDVEDPLMQQIRWMDKLVDEVARGKKMTSILRGGGAAGSSDLDRQGHGGPHPSHRRLVEDHVPTELSRDLAGDRQTEP